jgi:hypothetical protein
VMKRRIMEILQMLREDKDRCLMRTLGWDKARLFKKTGGDQLVVTISPIKIRYCGNWSKLTKSKWIISHCSTTLKSQRWKYWRRTIPLSRWSFSIRIRIVTATTEKHNNKETYQPF